MSGHSDLGPSSKDWQPGSAGRDEDFTPEKDRWTASRKGDPGAGRPGEDIQPGTQHEGRSWQSRRPRPGDEDSELEEELEDTFPASDAPTVTQPGVTGWELAERDRAEAGRWRRADRGRGSWRERVRTTSPGWPLLAIGLALLPVLVVSALTRSRPRRSRPRRP
jgi:hypothetical protein